MLSNVLEELREVIRNRRLLDGDQVVDWLEQSVSQDGPWNTHECPKRKINSFLKHKLAMQGHETLDIRRYLDPSDDDDVWCDSVCDKVIPFLEREIRA